MIDGGVEGICLDKEEDMLVAVCYIAECVALGRQIELDTFNMKREKERIIDKFLQLLTFK